MTDGLTASDVALIQGNGRSGDGLWGGDGAWWIVLFLIFGWGRNGYGGFGGGDGSGAAQNYVLASDFATIQRQLSDGFNSIDNALDRQNAGICDLGYTNLSLANQTNTNILTTGNAIQSQLADCCCKTQSGIERINTGNAMNTASILNQMQSCCCDIEKQNMQTNYNMATQNCATLQAIDKVGDRIIDYMSTQNLQALRDENQALRLAASQACQNNTIINALRPAPIPSFNVPNPYGYYNNGCGCGCN